MKARTKLWIGLFLIVIIFILWDKDGLKNLIFIQSICGLLMFYYDALNSMSEESK